MDPPVREVPIHFTSAGAGNPIHCRRHATRIPILNAQKAVGREGETRAVRLKHACGSFRRPVRRRSAPRCSRTNLVIQASGWRAWPCARPRNARLMLVYQKSEYGLERGSGLEWIKFGRSLLVEMRLPDASDRPFRSHPLAHKALCGDRATELHASTGRITTTPWRIAGSTVKLRE